MRTKKITLLSSYLFYQELISLTVERIWIPLTLGVNQHWLARIKVESNHHGLPLILLLPYETPACRFQHKSLAAHINRRGQANADVISSLIFTKSDGDNTFQDLKFDSFTDLTQGIIKLCQGDLIFATGAIDSFMATCPSNTFFGNFVVPNEFIELIHTTKIKAQDLVVNYSAIVLADGAYIYNRALISSALKLGKRVYIFNPDGDWLEFTKEYGENHKNFERYLKMLSPEEYDSALAEAKTYLDARFKGKQTDLDSPRVFSENVAPLYVKPKKVLFMHVFRDANQVQLDPDSTYQSLFKTYFEWADFCLREVAKKPSEWKVKIHPSSKFKRGDIEIQHLLLRKHGISMDLVDSCPKTSQILQNRWPIFTHSGTVALESAVFGYRSHVCSSRHPEQLVHLARSESQLTEQLRKPPSTIEDPLETVEVEMARLLLHWIFKHDLPLLAPKNPKPDRRNRFRFNVSLLAQEISLMGRYLRPRVQIQLQKMAQEITCDLE